jgi:hypothetical protein
VVNLLIIITAIAKTITNPTKIFNGKAKKEVEAEIWGEFSPKINDV